MHTGGSLGRLHPLVAGEAYPSWFRPFVELEKIATSLRTWESVVVPGLLQTEDYARAILRGSRPRDSDARIDEMVTARLARQEILRTDNPPDLWVVIDEGVLRRPVGEPGVMTAQLDQLIAAARDPWITIQVMLAAAGASGPDGALRDRGIRLGPGRRISRQHSVRPGHRAVRRRPLRRGAL